MLTARKTHAVEIKKKPKENSMQPSKVIYIQRQREVAATLCLSLLHHPFIKKEHNDIALLRYSYDVAPARNCIFKAGLKRVPFFYPSRSPTLVCGRHCWAIESWNLDSTLLRSSACEMKYQTTTNKTGTHDRIVKMNIPAGNTLVLFQSCGVLRSLLTYTKHFLIYSFASAANNNKYLR